RPPVSERAARVRQERQGRPEGPRGRGRPRPPRRRGTGTRAPRDRRQADVAEPHTMPELLRRLTPGEQALGREMFGDDLNLRRVRILAIPAWNRPFVAGPR